MYVCMYVLGKHIYIYIYHIQLTTKMYISIYNYTYVCTQKALRHVPSGHQNPKASAVGSRLRLLLHDSTTRISCSVTAHAKGMSTDTCGEKCCYTGRVLNLGGFNKGLCFRRCLGMVRGSKGQLAMDRRVHFDNACDGRSMSKTPSLLET